MGFNSGFKGLIGALPCVCVPQDG